MKPSRGPWSGPTRCRSGRGISVRSAEGNGSAWSLASALAQDPDVLLLDEPTTFLDVKHQLAIQGILRDLCRTGILVVAATHDLNLAAAYSDRIVVLQAGKAVADGDPRAALDPDTVRSVFEVNAVFREDSHGRPWIQYEA